MLLHAVRSLDCAGDYKPMAERHGREREPPHHGHPERSRGVCSWRTHEICRCSHTLRDPSASVGMTIDTTARAASITSHPISVSASEVEGSAIGGAASPNTITPSAGYPRQRVQRQGLPWTEDQNPMCRSERQCGPMSILCIGDTSRISCVVHYEPKNLRTCRSFHPRVCGYQAPVSRS